MRLHKLPSKRTIDSVSYLILSVSRMSDISLQVEGSGLDITPAIRSYIEKKISKFNKYSSYITNVKVRCTEKTAHRGKELDFKIEFTVDVPNTIIRVEKKGSDMYALIDEIVDVVVRKLNRYKEIVQSWKSGELEENYFDEIPDSTDDQHLYYVPKVSKRKRIELSIPIHESEAIERMELADLSFFLFQNRETGKWSVVYKRDDGSYGIIEPSN